MISVPPFSVNLCDDRISFGRSVFGMSWKCQTSSNICGCEGESKLLRGGMLFKMKSSGRNTSGICDRSVGLGVEIEEGITDKLKLQIYKNDGSYCCKTGALVAN